MKFSYIAVRINDNTVVKGEIEAASEQAAKSLLEVNKLEVMMMDKVKKGVVISDLALGKISDMQLLFFVKNLSIMLKAGLPLFESLVMLRDQSKGKLRVILGKVIDDFASGKRLSDCLMAYPRDFPGLITQLIKAGELSGTLENNLEYIADFLRKEIDLKKKVRSAMLYPSIIFLAVIGLSVSIGLFVLPQILPLFKSLDVKLPFTTRVLLWFAEFFKEHGITLIIGVILAFVSLPFVLENKYVRPFSHRMYLRIPIFGLIIKQLNLARFSRTLATLLNAGISIDGALDISMNIVRNRAYRNQVKRMRTAVVQGDPISAAVEKAEFYFPVMFMHMIRVGERSGNLAESLDYIGKMYDEEVDDKMKNLSTILEPVLLIFIGLLVGGVAMAILGPIYSLTGNIR